jgi:thiamine biosynthesis lipoprotein
MIRHWLIGLALVFTTLALLPAQPQTALLKRYSFEERHMGTLFRIVLYAPDEEVAKKAAAAAFERIAQLDRIMSDYKDDSELMLLCKKAGSGPVPVSDDLLTVLQRAREISEMSDGAFDVTVGPVVKLWRRARRNREMPTAKEIERAVQLVDYRRVSIDATKKTVTLLKEGIQIDLGGIAKGYAAEAALAVLRRFGIARALVAGGGDVAVLDPPPGTRGWKIALGSLANPAKEASAYLALANACVSTSGDAEQFVLIDGKRFSHHVDPKTGMALVGRRSVSVIAFNGKQADGVATAACVLGPQRGKEMLEARPDYAGLLVFETGDGLMTTPTSNFETFRWKE